MAGIRVSRRKGLTFGNVNISNAANDGVFLMRVEKPSSPTLSRVDITSPGRDGSVSIRDRFLDREITVVIGIYKEDIEERRQTQRTITRGLILKEDKLYFHDEPTKYYIGEVFDEVEEDEQDFFTELTFKFKCKPFIYDDQSSASWTGITGPVSKQINNKGNYDAKPVFTITGTATRLSITAGSVEFSIKDIADTTYVDSENMNVYKIVSGKKVSVLQNFTGLFPTIPVGTSNVVIAGTTINVGIKVDFKNTYVC